MHPPDKVTVMILDVDLKCSCCYKKVKKLLCKFPQIRDQVFDEEKNKVIITVICCDPEKLRDKLCCKGGKVIRSIEILEKPKQPKKTPPKPDDDKPKNTEEPKQPQPENSKPKADPPPKDLPPPKKPDSVPNPIDGYPFCPPPVSVCCQECYQGRGGGPCHYGYGRPVPPPPGPCFDGTYGYQYGGNRPCYVSRCDYFSEDNPQGCSIM